MFLQLPKCRKWVRGVSFERIPRTWQTVGPISGHPDVWTAFINIENSHTAIARPGTTICRPYKYLFQAGNEPATRSTAVDPLNHCTNRAVKSFWKDYLSDFYGFLSNSNDCQTSVNDSREQRLNVLSEAQRKVVIIGHPSKTNLGNAT